MHVDVSSVAVTAAVEAATRAVEVAAVSSTVTVTTLHVDVSSRAMGAGVGTS